MANTSGGCPHQRHGIVLDRRESRAQRDVPPHPFEAPSPVRRRGRRTAQHQGCARPRQDGSGDPEHGWQDTHLQTIDSQEYVVWRVAKAGYADAAETGVVVFLTAVLFELGRGAENVGRYATRGMTARFAAARTTRLKSCRSGGAAPVEDGGAVWHLLSVFCIAGPVICCKLGTQRHQ